MATQPISSKVIAGTAGAAGVGAPAATVLVWLWGILYPDIPMPPAVSAAFGAIIASVVGLASSYIKVERRHVAMLLVFGLPFLGGCQGIQSQAKEIGTEAFESAEGSSELGVMASRRYLCRTARIGPLQDLIWNTQEDRDAWSQICSSNPQPPDVSPAPP